MMTFSVSEGVFSFSVLRIKSIFGNLPLFVSKAGRVLVHGLVMV